MVRNILLGLLVGAIVPITFTKATATRSTEVTVTPRVTKNFDLAQFCTPAQQVTYCLSPQANNSNNLEAYSQLWLKDIARILFSGSMFKRCKTRFGQKQSLNADGSTASIQKFASPGCIFTWQYLNQVVDRQDKNTDFVSTNLTSNFDDSQDLADSTPVSQTPVKFPKLSRTSLIVSFPTENSTFVTKSVKLANPAPETKRIASPFGWRRRPYSYQLQFHQGVDYGAPLGSPVVAVGDGIVTRVTSGCYDFGNLFCGGQLGNWIEIDHGNGALGTYGHLKNGSISIKEGMKVWKNQQIAQVGSSGWSTGAHLDFRFKINGEYEDPAKYVTAIDQTDIE